MPTESQLKAMRENGRKSGAKLKANGFFSSEKQSQRRKQQLVNEEAMAESLRLEGFEVLSPTVVCDRIAIKDGRVYFVEFKKTGQSLRAGQQLVRDLVPDQYIIRYE